MDRLCFADFAEDRRRQREMLAAYSKDDQRLRPCFQRLFGLGQQLGPFGAIVKRRVANHFLGSKIDIFIYSFENEVDRKPDQGQCENSYDEIDFVRKFQDPYLVSFAPMKSRKVNIRDCK